MEAAVSPLLCSHRRLSSSPRSRRLVINISSTSNATHRLLCSQKSIKASSRYAILGAGFAGLSVAWHLLQHASKESSMSIDIYDEVGLGGGASGFSGGLLHPYSPKAKLLWRGSESWKECLKLLAAAERAVELRDSSRTSHDDGPIILRRGILRPATTETKIEILRAALFLACKNFANEASTSAHAMKEIRLCKEHVNSLLEIDGEYDAVAICLGAKVRMLPELSGNLPLRSCRGIIAQLELPIDIREEYGKQCPSILSNAWLAFQGPRSVLMGSTWDWSSNNYLSYVTPEEASKAMEQLLPKASAIYPAIKKWKFVGARAGLRAMPPLTSLGSLPLLGCVTEAVGGKDRKCQYWLVTGLGSRGLLYHGLLGKLIAQAMISSDETVLPSELTSWKNMEARNQTL